MQTTAGESEIANQWAFIMTGSTAPRDLGQIAAAARRMAAK